MGGHISTTPASCSFPWPCCQDRTGHTVNNRTARRRHMAQTDGTDAHQTNYRYLSSFSLPFCRWTWVSWFPFLSPLLQKRIFGITGTGFFYGPDVLTVTELTVSKHCRKHKVLANTNVMAPPFFIHHRTPDGLALLPLHWCQNQLIYCKISSAICTVLTFVTHLKGGAYYTSELIKPANFPAMTNEARVSWQWRSAYITGSVAPVVYGHKGLPDILGLNSCYRCPCHGQLIEHWHYRRMWIDKLQR